MESNIKVLDEPRITSLTEIDLHALSEIRDAKDTFLTAYFGATGRDSEQSFVESRLNAIKKALPKDLLEAFQETLDMAESALSAPGVKGERGRVIFASASAGLLHVYRLSVEPESLVVWDSSPFLLPLAKLTEEYEDYGLLLIDSQEARLFLVKSNLLEENEKASIDLMNKHKKGGWSQMRYNRLRRGQISSFFTQLIEDLQKNEDLTKIRGLVVAGPGEAKGQLVEMMPHALKEKVIGIMDISMDGRKVERSRTARSSCRLWPVGSWEGPVGRASGFSLDLRGLCPARNDLHKLSTHRFRDREVPHLWRRSGGAQPGEHL
jgi:peptide chain release factor subunit 1